jgi:hypothetical protein
MNVKMYSKTVVGHSGRIWPAVGILFRLGHLGLGFSLGVTFNMAMAKSDTKNIALNTINTPAIIHLIERGDTLWRISERYYGQALKWPEIRYDNRIAEPRRLKPGATLLLRSDGVGNSATVLAVTGDVRLVKPITQKAKAATSFAGKFITNWSSIGTAAMADGDLINKGDNIAVGSTLVTGPDSFITLLMPNGSRATLPSNSQIKLVSFKGAKGKPSVLLDLNMGQVDARVQHSDEVSGKSSYRVRTRMATIGARGTYFRVTLPDSQRVLVGVLEGRVVANLGSESTWNDKSSRAAQPGAAFLAMGQGLTFNSDASSKKNLVQDLLPAPILQDASAPQNQRDVLVSWLPVQGAQAYRVQMARDADFNDLIAQQDISSQGEIQNSQAVSQEGYKTWFSNLTTGSYFVRVSAIATDGLEGLFVMAGFTRLNYEVSELLSHVVDNEQIEFSWTALPGSNYWLELAEDIDFSKVVLSVPNLLSNRVQIAALAAGQYFWRVKANIQEQGQTTTVVSKINPLLVGGSR